jgi:asparagine synthase (glutamine-hydrolysing)
MCGIAGVFDPRAAPVDEALVERMGASIAHRGPDDDGTFVADGIGLASRRLAIIDLSPAGHQPMPNEDGSLQLVFNGELYDYPRLRGELEARGHVFRSHTDTEVAVHAYEEWGDAFVERLNGMFALAIWDARRRRLVLARDRFGIKPLYWAEHDGRFLFASELKALLAAGLPRRLSAEAASEYFTFQNVLGDHTLLAGARMLPAGHLLVLEPSGARSVRWWDALPEPEEGVSPAEWSERTRAAFEVAVERQLVSDAPLGSFLSGGIDSGSIVAVAGTRRPHLMTFTGGFDLSSASGLELVFDERDAAELVARTFGTEHYEIVMHAGDMARVLPELVWHLEDLRVGMSYQNFYIARLASKFVKVALAGTGGDELFAGYPWRYEPLLDVAPAAFEDLHYRSWMRLVPDADRGRFFGPELWPDARSHEPRDAYRELMAPAAALPPLDRALYFETKAFLHGLLVVEDKVSMAHGLEARVPFLDNELADLALRIPARLKYGARGKDVLRDAVATLLPAALVDKPKQGFSPPDQSWYRGATRGYIESVLLDPRTESRGLIRPEYVRNVLDEHFAGRENHRLLVWSLLAFEWWCRLFLDGDSPTL